ncbi:hypothetical protein P8452_51968 [Trifolium repens]|nr:hypothetical protein P8452_51968 [Trifolium repens]
MFMRYLAFIGIITTCFRGGGWISFWYMESYVAACVEPNNFSFLKSQCLRCEEEELKYGEGLQPTSKCCNELADYVVANSDPLLPSNKKNHWSCCLWKWLWHHFIISQVYFLIPRNF